MPVHFEMALQSVSQLSAVESAMVLESWWRIYWTDERLRWDPDEFGGLGTIMVDSTDVRALTPPAALTHHTHTHRHKPTRTHTDN